MKPEDQSKNQQAIQSMPDSKTKADLLKQLKTKSNPQVDVKK